jgi:hypothetical protein|tara:strand:- start:97 stop:354 length:258 start_codon:yes stop_codon:yes gene_type:complete
VSTLAGDNTASYARGSRRRSKLSSRSRSARRVKPSSRRRDDAADSGEEFEFFALALADPNPNPSIATSPLPNRPVPPYRFCFGGV